MDGTTVAVMLPHPTNLVATCTDGRQEARVVSGYFTIRLPPTCQVTTPEMWIRTGSEEWKGDVTVAVTLNASEAENILLLEQEENNDTAWRPHEGHLNFISKSVTDILNSASAMPSTWMIVAVTLALLALAILAAFLTFFYSNAKSDV